jgi:hypothetical protein
MVLEYIQWTVRTFQHDTYHLTHLYRQINPSFPANG